MKKKSKKTKVRAAGKVKSPARDSGKAPGAEYAWLVHERQGMISLTGPGGVPVLDRFWAEIELDSGDVLTTCQAGFSVGPGYWVSEMANRRILLEVSLRRSANPSGLLVAAAVRNRGSKPLFIRQIRIVRAEIGRTFSGSSPVGKWKLLRMGYAPGGAHREDPDTRTSALVSFDDEQVRTRSWGAAALEFGRGDGGVVMGFLTSEKQMTWIDVRKDRDEVELIATCETEGRVIAPGAVLESETLYIGLNGDLARGLREFGELSARKMRVILKPVPSGWCSWHCFGKDVTEDRVLKHADFLAERRDALPLKVLEIDDGYARTYGDWLDPSDKFPHGLEWLAGRIRDRNLSPGIWVAPFVASASSKLFNEHPDWMVKDGEGNPLGWEIESVSPRELMYALDGSNPAACHWLSRLFRTLKRFGFRYFKLDLLFMGCLRGERAESVTRVEAYRQGLGAIRSAVGDAYVLGSACPSLPSVGLIDGNRVSNAISDQGLWNGFREASRETHQHFWAHGTLWNTDHDVIVAGEVDGVALETNYALATSVALSGGALFSGDSLPELPADRLGILAGALRDRDAGTSWRRRSGKAARSGSPPAALPMDLFQREYPRVLVSSIGARKFRIGAFNDSEVPRVIVIELNRLGLGLAMVSRLNDTGEPELLGHARGRWLTPPVPAHGCVQLLVEGK